MLGYYFELAWRALRRQRALTALMVLALGLGIGACMTTLTVYHVLSGDPIPSKSDRLFDVELDAASRLGWEPGQEPGLQLTRLDAEELLRQHRAVRQVMMSGGNLPVMPETPGVKPVYVPARLASADFFAMFDAPFLRGGGWDAAADAAQARVAVIARELAEHLFGSTDVVGRDIVLRGQHFRVIGVLDTWHPSPHYYDLTMGTYAQQEQVYLPFSTALAMKFGSSGNMNCWGSPAAGDARSVGAPCAWIQYWVELARPADAAAFRQYLVRYSEDQARAGRFERPPNARLRNVMDWLVQRKALPGDVTLQVWLAFGFLLVCIVNTVGLLLAKCLRRAPEIGVRRALGASRREIFAQFLVEAGAIGLAGGVLGLVLSWAGVWLVRQGTSDSAQWVHMDAVALV
ncbi:MAG TPA: ABC transporter permease, partial [Burkholderiaceae bacterium]|nr:ABC transporter permease [Burkholderiaceae bacterium]